MRMDAQRPDITVSHSIALSQPPPEIEWEGTSCPLCGGQRWTRRIDATDRLTAGGCRFVVVQCLNCDLWFTNPRPTVASIGQFYPSGYQPHQVCGLRASRVGHARRQRFLPDFWRMHNLERHGIPWHGAGRLLDVGCGGGSFLHRMHLQGWQVTGIDVHQPVIQRINTQLGLSALAGSLPHPSLKSDSFDVVTFWQSLEHMHWPLQMLREAHRLLAPGGKLVVGVPNIASGPFRWFGPDWFPLELPRHLVHFSPATLRQMLEAAGFLDPETQFVRAPTWLQSSARIARDRHHGSLLLHSLALRPLSRVVADYLKFTGQSEYITAIASKPAHAAVAQQPRRAMTG